MSRPPIPLLSNVRIHDLGGAPGIIIGASLEREWLYQVQEQTLLDFRSLEGPPMHWLRASDFTVVAADAPLPAI